MAFRRSITIREPTHRIWYLLTKSATPRINPTKGNMRAVKMTIESGVVLS